MKTPPSKEEPPFCKYLKTSTSTPAVILSLKNSLIYPGMKFRSYKIV